MMWYAAISRFANRRQESRPPRGRIRQGEMKDENQVPGRGVDSVAHDGGSHGCLRARSDAGGEGQGAPVSGDDQEGCSGGYKGAVGSAVELQASAGPLVRGTGDGAYRGGGGPYPRKAGGKGHDGASWGCWARREENRRSSAGDGSRPHPQSAGAGAADTDEPFRVAGSLDQAFRGDPGGYRRFSENDDGATGSRDGQSAGKAGWVRVCPVHRRAQRTAHQADQ